jgi:hypothetical protein
MQLCVVPIPPQSTVRVEFAAFHVPVHPVRLAVPSRMAPFVNEPSSPIIVVPFNPAGPDVVVDTSVIVHMFWVMHCGALALRLRQPAPGA